MKTVIRRRAKINSASVNAPSVNGPPHAVDEALRLVALGYPVFPCDRRKKPLTEHGWKDATTDPDTIRRWWVRWPWANPAVATAGLLVVDLDTDPRSPWIGDEDREGTLIRACGAISITPRGGFHFWFRRPPGVSWSISAGDLAEGTDIRTDGGYVVVPPGRTAKGRYAWSPVYGPLSTPPEELPLPPDWLCDLLDRGGGKRTGPSANGKIPKGQRNDRLTSIAGSLRNQGLDCEELEATLRTINEVKCDPPIGEKDVRGIAKSIGGKPVAADRGEPPVALDVPHSRKAEPKVEQRAVSAMYVPNFRTLADLEADTDDAHEWLVTDILVKDEPCVIGGPPKSFKTSLLVDLAVALTVPNGEFLRKFPVPEQRRVVVLSSESGKKTLRALARTIVGDRCWPTTPLEWDGDRFVQVPWLPDSLFFDFQPPKLGAAANVEALVRTVEKERIDVCTVDPVYLSFTGGPKVDPKNLYEMGPLFLTLAHALQSVGCTTILAHHTKKTTPSGHPPELGDLAYAGISEFARQWMLLNHREPFDPETGTGKLWLSVGGSAEHGGRWGLDVTTGRVRSGEGDALDLDDEGAPVVERFVRAADRRWEVVVRDADDCREEQAEAKSRARTRGGDEDLMQRVLAAVDGAGGEASVRKLRRYCALGGEREGGGGGGGTARKLRTDCGEGDKEVGAERMGRVLKALVDAGVLERTEVVVEGGSGATRTAEGVRRPEPAAPAAGTVDLFGTVHP